MGKALTSFATSYKKKKGFNEVGIVYDRIESGSGRTEAQAFFTEQLAVLKSKELLDLSAVAKQFSGLNFLFGLRNVYAEINATPNSCAMLMLLAAGKVEHTLFEITSTCKALQEMAKPKATMKEVLDSLTALDLLGFKQLCGLGAKVYHCTQEPEQTLYCPTGWLHGVHTHPNGGPVVYGLHKSFFLTGDSDGVARYCMMKELLGAAGRDVAKMEQIEALMRGE